MSLLGEHEGLNKLAAALGLDPASPEFDAELRRLYRQRTLARAAGGRNWAKFSTRKAGPMELHEMLNDQEAVLASGEHRRHVVALAERLFRAERSHELHSQLLLAHADRGLPVADFDAAAMLAETRTLVDSCRGVEEFAGETNLDDELEGVRERTLKAAISRGPGADIGVTLSEAIADPSVGVEEEPAAAEIPDPLASVDQLVAEARALTERIRSERAAQVTRQPKPVGPETLLGRPLHARPARWLNHIP